MWLLIKKQGAVDTAPFHTINNTSSIGGEYMEESLNDKTRETNASLLENLNGMSHEMLDIKQKCEKWRKYLDEGAYKLDAVLNIIDGMKNREQSFMAAGAGPEAMHHMNEEQVDNILEMMKSPAFQSVAKQILTKWANISSTANSDKSENKSN